MRIFVIITTIVAGISVLIAWLPFAAGCTEGTPGETSSSLFLMAVFFLLFAIFLLLLQGPIKIIFS
jgi:hypothetical protein